MIRLLSRVVLASTDVHSKFNRTPRVHGRSSRREIDGIVIARGKIKLVSARSCVRFIRERQLPIAFHSSVKFHSKEYLDTSYRANKCAEEGNFRGSGIRHRQTERSRAIEIAARFFEKRPKWLEIIRSGARGNIGRKPGPI